MKIIEAPQEIPTKITFVHKKSEECKTYYANFSRMKSRHISSDEIVIVPLRELSYKDAKREIVKYIGSVGNRKVYISEIAEKLRLDIELIMQIFEELETKKKS